MTRKNTNPLKLFFALAVLIIAYWLIRPFYIMLIGKPPICIDSFNPPSNWESQPENRLCIINNIVDNQLFVGQPIDSLFEQMGVATEYDENRYSQSLLYFTDDGSVFGYYCLHVEIEGNTVKNVELHND